MRLKNLNLTIKIDLKGLSEKIALQNNFKNPVKKIIAFIIILCIIRYDYYRNIVLGNKIDNG